MFVNYLSHSQTSCDLDYYVNNNTNDTCLVAGDDLTLSFTSNVIFTVLDSNGTLIWNSFSNGANTSAIWSSSYSGFFTIQAVTAGFPSTVICEQDIIIAPGVVSITNPIYLDYCQWNTINLEENLDSYIQNSTNPQYEFGIGGLTIDGTAYQITDTDSIFIDVLITDESGCIINTELIIIPTTNNTVPRPTIPPKIQPPITAVSSMMVLIPGIGKLVIFCKPII